MASQHFRASTGLENASKWPFLRQDTVGLKTLVGLSHVLNYKSRELLFMWNVFVDLYSIRN